MARNLNPKCRQCRRSGEKLFLKGDRCISTKCAILKKNYPPGIHGAKQTRAKFSEYGKQLREKQKAKRIYGILEKQFKNYFLKAAKKKKETGEILLKILEMRLDNIIYRVGLAKSRNKARQLVSHGHFLVNNKKVNIPSYEVNINDVIKIKKKSEKLGEESKKVEKDKIPLWLFFDIKENVYKILSEPKKEDLPQNIDTRLIVESYSK
ncbi:30S ribosomal protein S4 [Candidatus Kuenenbacteria bacterium HGW-Kuenenbacteria-1]|uniref:Small ribosomal subunit protein uS4 n=1 Tax=Candidatus Kuenenbacteria bacterium HGW-Kuenenbacteria-1 TaxID=2013812 RepID=A0A2N1UNJ5_9BACT|nr:MAG: 30S ribosomal protein S4 [Candidatus Kuenenbacteria bacterium HGW-Kuenenbacteria-1]